MRSLSSGPAKDTGMTQHGVWPEISLGKAHTAVGPCPFPEATPALGRRACHSEQEVWDSLWEGHDIVVCAVSQLLSGICSRR